MTFDLVNKTVPLIRLDKNLSASRSKFLNENYDFDEDMEEDQSTAEILSGTLNDCPFFTERYISYGIGIKYYEGSLEVEWVEYETDSDGNVYEVKKSQVLNACIEKPYPEYYDVPVEWDEYLPVQNSKTMCLVELDLNSHEFSEIEDQEEFLSLVNSVRKGDYAYRNGIFAYVGDITKDAERAFAKYKKQ